MINREIGGNTVRIERTAMLQNPTKLSQTKFLLMLSKSGIACKMTNWGDILVDRQFTNELVDFNFIDKQMEIYVWDKNVDHLIFVSNLAVR